MENASKALIIAGGILISLIVISMLMLVANSLGAGARANEERIEHEQMVAFNRRFEAFNRDRLNGQDVISLVNMAINNNQNPAVDGDGDPMFINVTLTVREGLRERYETVTVHRDGRIERREGFGDPRQILAPRVEHSLMQANNMMNPDFTAIFERPPRPVTVTEQTADGGQRTTTTFSIAHDFRSGIFESTGVEHTNGRISEIRLRQIR